MYVLTSNLEGQKSSLSPLTQQCIPRRANSNSQTTAYMQKESPEYEEFVRMNTEIQARKETPDEDAIQKPPSDGEAEIRPVF